MSPSTAAPPGNGLIVDSGWERLRGHCGACRSIRLVTQNRGSRETWLSMIRWMLESQGRWQLDEMIEAAILDYLECNHGPAAVLPPAQSIFRRARLRRTRTQKEVIRIEAIPYRISGLVCS